jgi:hypothetical protein
MSNETFRKYLFWLFALLLVGAAFHHLYEYFVPELRPEYPASRHIMVFCIDIVLAIFMLKRSKYFLPVLFLITIQQLYGHGGNLLNSFSGAKAALYTDWLVVIFAPIIFISYYYDIYNNGKDS